MKWLLVLLLLPVVAAHGDAEFGEVLPHGSYLNHIQMAEAELAPAEARNWTLAFGGPAGGGVMHEGWHWLVRADVQGEVRARLFIDGQLLASWSWRNGPQQEFVRVPFDAFLTLDIANVGQDNATVRFYYDQTCDCIGKVVPATTGPVWFNADARKGDQVRFNFTVEPVRLQPGDAELPGNITVRARHLVPDDLGGYVPKGAVSLAWDLSGPSCGQGRWSGCFDFPIVAQEDGMQLVLVETSHDGDAAWGTGVRPVITHADGRDAPVPVWILPVAWGLVLAGRREI